MSCWMDSIWARESSIFLLREITMNAVWSYVRLARCGIALKSEGNLNMRARRVALLSWFALVLLTVLSLIATLYVRPQVTDNFRLRPWGWIIPLIVLASLVSMRFFLRKGRD